MVGYNVLASFVLREGIELEKTGGGQAQARLNSRSQKIGQEDDVSCGCPSVHKVSSCKSEVRVHDIWQRLASLGCFSLRTSHQTPYVRGYYLIVPHHEH